MRIMMYVLLTAFLVGQSQAYAQKEESSKQNSNATQTQKAPVIKDTRLPVYVGANTVGKVENVRETVGDLVDALQNARDGYGLENAKSFDQKVGRWSQELDVMERSLDLRASWARDDSFFDDFEEAIPVTVSTSVGQLARIMSEIAQSLEGGKKTTSLPARVADDVVDQVEDVRETVEDLVQSLRDIDEDAPFVLLAQKQKELAALEQELDLMAIRLDWKESDADEEWTAWFGSDVYKVTIHRAIADLAGAMDTIAVTLGAEASVLDRTAH